MASSGGTGAVAGAGPGGLGGLNAFGGLGLLSSAAGGLSQIFAGIAAKNQADQNAKVLKRLGVAAAEEARRDLRALQGAQINAHPGDATEGSALDIAADTAVEGEVAARRAQFQFDAQAIAEEDAGLQALVASITRGSGTILGGTVKALGQVPASNPGFGSAEPTDSSVPFGTIF
jgi:hypothetical protein